MPSIHAVIIIPRQHLIDVELPWDETFRPEAPWQEPSLSKTALWIKSRILFILCSRVCRSGALFKFTEGITVKCTKSVPCTVLFVRSFKPATVVASRVGKRCVYWGGEEHSNTWISPVQIFNLQWNDACTIAIPRVRPPYASYVQKIRTYRPSYATQITLLSRIQVVEEKLYKVTKGSI